MQKKICVIGNTVADFIAAPVENIPQWGELQEISNPINMNIGGNGAIFSACAARLGLEPYLISKIGTDEIGKQLMKAIKAFGVNTTWTQQDKTASTSVTLALANTTGERMFFHHIGSNAKLTSKDFKSFPMKDMSALLLCSMFILPGIKSIDAENIFKQARKYNIPTFLDVAWDPSGNWDLGDVHPHVDFFIPNEKELEQISLTTSLKLAAERLHKKGMGAIVVKQGAAGCTVFIEEKRPRRIKAPKVKAVDTTGAGDAFNAGFIYSYLKTRDVLASAKYAVFTASKTVTTVGGTNNAPTDREVKRFMKKTQ